MVNKFANIEQTDNSKKREIYEHTKTFVNLGVFDANKSQEHRKCFYLCCQCILLWVRIGFSILPTWTPSGNCPKLR